ncbi:MAG TPA: hypothetical protein VI877_02490, partial [Dehalococcoidia bacterium]|nr:hypothetical protein [Dehalococcoidia bacterium]
MGRKRVTLCGQQFDIVEQGLSEAQVAACLTEVMAQMKAMSEHGDPLTELCQACEQIEGVLRETRTVLVGARETAFKAVEQEKQRVLREAYNRAQETQAQAQHSAQAIKKEAHEALAAARAEVESILLAARKQASELLAMSSERASAVLLEAGERIQSELVSKLKAQAEEALTARLKVAGQPPAKASPAVEAPQDTTTPEGEADPQGEKAGGEEVFDSRVLLLVHSPKGDGAMKSFHQQLSSLRDVKIAAERGSSESMELTIELERPMALKELLLGLPQVQKVTAEDSHRWQPWRSPKGVLSHGATLRVELVEA